MTGRKCRRNKILVKRKCARIFTSHLSAICPFLTLEDANALNCTASAFHTSLRNLLNECYVDMLCHFPSKKVQTNMVYELKSKSGRYGIFGTQSLVQGGWISCPIFKNGHLITTSCCFVDVEQNIELMMCVNGHILKRWYDYSFFN